MRDDFDRLGLVAVSASDGEAAVKLCEELIESTVDISWIAMIAICLLAVVTIGRIEPRGG